MKRLRLSPAQQEARTRELDALRLVRDLTVAERQEAGRLADALYHRLWRQTQRETYFALTPGADRRCAL